MPPDLLIRRSILELCLLSKLRACDFVTLKVRYELHDIDDDGEVKQSEIAPATCHV